MWKFSLILAVLMVGQDKVFGNTALTRQNEISGPVSNVMENLAIHTSQVTDELISQLSTKIEGTSQTILGDIEVILASAMDRLSEPVIAIQSQLASSECQELLSLEVLRERVDSKLSDCTRNLNDLLVAFQSDSDNFSQSLQLNVREIANLPNHCEVVENSFASIMACFIDKIAEVNRDVALVLNRASMAILQTHQLAKEGAESARTCADLAVADAVEYLDGLIAKCQIVENNNK